MSEFDSIWYHAGFFFALGAAFCHGLLAVLKWICNAIGARYG